MALGNTIIATLVMSWVSASCAAPSGTLGSWPQECADHDHCALNQPFTGYPQDLVDELLDEYNVTLAEPKAIAYERQGKDYINLCGQNVSPPMLSLYAVKDAEQRTRVVVQSSTFRQQVILESCSKAGRVTGYGNGVDPSHLSENFLYCREERLGLPLVVLSVDGRRLESLRVCLPVLCTCRLLVNWDKISEPDKNIYRYDAC